MTSSAVCIRLAALSLVAVALIAGPVGAEEDDAGLATVHALGERPATGRLVELGATTAVLAPLTGEARREFALDGVREIRLRNSDGTRPDSHRARLVGGEVLLGTFAGATEADLTLDVEGVGRTTIIYDVLSSFETLEAPGDPCEDLADRYGPDEDGRDVAYLRSTGDRTTGTLMEADGKQLVIENERGTQRSIPWTELSVLHLQNPKPEAVPTLQAEVELVGGSRFFCAEPPVLTAGRLAFALLSDPETKLSVPLTAVRALRYAGGRFVYASDLPFESSFTPFYPVPEGMAFEGLRGRKRFWGARRDRRPSGCPLRIARQVYRHGFSAHSTSVIRIPLDGTYASFEVSVGIDDEVRDSATEAKHAKIQARVRLDGKEAAEKTITLDDSPHRFGPFDVTGVKMLELVVDHAGSPVGDDAAWVDPILVKKE